MATIPNQAALLAPALPLPLRSGQLLALRSTASPSYRGEAPIVSDAVQTIGTGAESLVSGPLPPVATVPPIGGFHPFGIADAAGSVLKGIKNAAGQVLDYLGQLWGALNNRTKTDGTPASYSRGAYTGSISSTSDNTFELRVSGIQYYWRPFGRNEPLGETVISNQLRWSRGPYSPAAMLSIPSWPATVTEEAGGKTYSCYHPSATVTAIITRANSTYYEEITIGIGFFKSDAAFTINVIPSNPVGAIPYFPDIPAVPAVADTAALRPAITVAAKAAAVLPAAAIPSKAKPAAAVPVIPLALPKVAPLVEVAPSIGGAARQITTATGTLRKLAPAEVPRIAPLPARPIPTLQPQITPAGQTLPAPAATPATTPTDQRLYGSQVITSIGVRPDVVAIAEEVGRMERKMGIMLEGADTTPDWLDGVLTSMLNRLVNALVDALVVDVPAATYQFSAPCDYDANGNRLVLNKQIAAADFEPAIVARLDAIADAIKVLKWWKTPTCRVNPPQSNVTVTAEEFDPEA
jgi:hypothetical protein